MTPTPPDDGLGFFRGCVWMLPLAALVWGLAVYGLVVLIF